MENLRTDENACVLPSSHTLELTSQPNHRSLGRCSLVGLCDTCVPHRKLMREYEPTPDSLMNIATVTMHHMFVINKCYVNGPSFVILKIYMR